MDDNVEKFRSLMKQNPDFAARVEEDVVGDSRLKRFVVARNGDLTKAKAMFEDHLRWRKENNIEEIRAKVIDKPFLVENFPHTAELRDAGMGLIDVVVNAGLSRLGDVVHIELLGGDHVEVPPGKSQEEYLQKLYEHYYGFFERRSIYLEDLSVKESKVVRCVQIRDFSKLSIMPQKGVFSVIRKILTSGIDNYPETASFAFFVNPPAIFSAVFAIVRRWLPEDTKKKLFFLSGEKAHEELLKYVHPPAVVALHRLLDGEYGDDIAKEFVKAPDLADTALYKSKFEKHVSARHRGHIYFGLSEASVKSISWKHENREESPKSAITASIFYVDRENEVGVPANLITVHTITLKHSDTVASLPPNAKEALLVLNLDNTGSWLHSHTFKVSVQLS